MTPWLVTIPSEVHRGDWREDHFQEIVVYGVYVTAPNGRRFAYCGPYDVGQRDKAERLAERVRHTVACRDPWTPIGNPHWTEVDPCYGSEEYERQGIEQDRGARERADFEAGGEYFDRLDAVRNLYMA